MKRQFPQSVKHYVVQFAKFYHRYKVESDRLRSVRYRIHSTLADYQKTKKIQLSLTDRPGDLLPPITINEIKKTPDILAGLHPIDVNSINDLFYLSQDKITDVRVHDTLIQIVTEDGRVTDYNVSDTFDHGNIASKRVAFMIGYMQAEKMMMRAYAKEVRYKIIKDNITTLQILDAQTNNEVLMSPLDILFSNDYLHFAKEDIMKIGYICGQMSKV